MAWRGWSKLYRGHKWLLFLYPLLLLLLTVSVMTITLSLPSAPAESNKRSSRALSSAGGFMSSFTVIKAAPASVSQLPLTQSLQYLTWRTRTGKESHNSDSKRRHTDLHEIHKNKGVTSKTRTISGTILQPTNHHHSGIQQLIVNKRPKYRSTPSNHSILVRNAAHITALADTLTSDTQAADRLIGRGRDRHPNRKEDMQIHSSHASKKLAERRQALERKATKNSKEPNKQHKALRKTSSEVRKHLNLPELPSVLKKDPGLVEHRKTLSVPKAAVKTNDSSWCQRLTEKDFPDGDQRRVRISLDLWPLPWLSEDDIQKMELLAVGEVRSKARVPAHGQVLQVSLKPPKQQQPSQRRASHQQRQDHGHAETHSEQCQQGSCSLIKRTDDWFEVFAFHLDRVLRLNRSLPAVLRTFHSDILPYRYITGKPRPVVWWDPDIRHLGDKDNDQNSVPLSWVQYQKLLQVRCGSEADLRSAPCVGVHHSEWGRLALFDFLLQVHDRLDRYCCGFTPDLTEMCVENLLRNKCDNTKELLLVHILVRKTDPSKLVFIDNAGRPHQSITNLNLRLVEGIDEFPEKALSVLQSGCLENLLLRSIYTDKELWDSLGGFRGVRPLIHEVEQRGKILLQHIKDRELQINRDL